MVFSSLEFIFIFLPIFFTVYYSVPKRFRNIVLLIGSLCFCIIGSIKHPFHIALLMSGIIADFAAGLLIEKRKAHRRLFLVLGILFHLICLCLFKYSAFITDELSRHIKSFNFSLDFVLPIGISFYTFQGISYIADIYKGDVKAEKSLIRYAVYISMFEQLIAGPIVTYGEVQKELKDREIKIGKIFEGLGTFIFGLGLKVLLANPIGKLWSQVCAIGFESISTPLAWMAIVAFSFQIYFDFFGYSLMAVGLGKMLGFKLPKNFDHPYTSLTMTEFWRRWHITLGSWFKNYVYIPLGGNRMGMATTVRNLFIVWVLTGIWHGAGYNFVLWGITLFAIITAEKFFIGKFLSKTRVISRIYMFFLIPLTWAIFAICDIGQLGVFFTRLFPFFKQGPWSVFRYDYVKYLKLYFPFFIAGGLFSSKMPFNVLKKIKSPFIKTVFLAVIFFASVYCMYRGFDDPFLYFRF